MRYLICLLLLLALLLVGCQPAASPAATTITATTLPTSTPAASRLTLKPCKAAGGAVEAECGTLRVPEDRSNPSGRTLDLGIVVVRAQGSNHEPDPLFYIAGGPGDAATQDGIVLGVRNLFSKVNASRDVIYLDQRGTNDKHHLTCEYPSFQIADAPQYQVNDWMKQCLASLDGDPRFYTTAEAMRDLDAARAALGYDKINLYGISYGAAAVQVYMRMFPERVRAAVIDHGTALDTPFAQAMPRASQEALDQVFTFCEQDEKCHAAYPDIRGEWQAVLDRLKKGPVVTSWTPPGADAPAQITKDMIVSGAHSRMKETGGYAALPSIIHTLATNTDWTDIVKSLSQQRGSNGEGEGMLFMAKMIFCFEPAWGFQPDEIARLNPGSYYVDVAVQDARSLPKMCAALPKPDPSLIYGPGKPVPLSALMLNSLIDPQNTPPNMEPALKEFTKSRIVVEPTEGHDTSLSNCRWDIITQYIQHGSVDGLDVSCMEKQKPSFVIGK